MTQKLSPKQFSLTKNLKVDPSQVAATVFCLLILVFASTSSKQARHAAPGNISHVDRFLSKSSVESVVFYSYYEPSSTQEKSSNSNTESYLAKTNLRFFIQNGVLGPNAPSPEEVTFVFIINGGYVSESIPDYLSNVHTFKRPNVGLEFCGVAEALEVFLEGFKYFFMINSSIRGPFLPNYFPATISWTTVAKQTLSDAVKLSGISINCYCCAHDQTDCKRSCSEKDGLKYLHVQSFFLVTDRTGLEIIRPSLACYDNKVDAIFNGEILFTNRILGSGFNVASMNKFWYGHDFREANATASLCTAVAKVTPTYNGDTQFAKSYFGMDHNPYESMFIKTNRGDFQAYKLYTRWSQKTNGRPLCYSEDENFCAARDVSPTD